MTKLYIGDQVMSKEQIQRAMSNAATIDKNDRVSQIMNEWYAELGKNGCAVQPKASTILGTILARHLSSIEETRDVWAEALLVKGGEFAGWYASLSPEEKIQYDEGRKNASKKYDPRNKQLLKG